MQTLDLDLGQVQGLGTVQGRMKSVSEVTLRVQDTRGIFLGTDARGSACRVQAARTEAWNEAIQALYRRYCRITPDWDWTNGGNMWVKQTDPLPMTILALMPDVTMAADIQVVPARVSHVRPSPGACGRLIVR
jgi:hypothetical protein